MEHLVPLEVRSAFPGLPNGRLHAGLFESVAYRRKAAGDVVAETVAFLRDAFASLEAVGLHDVVVGLSGGLDSVVVSRLCQLAAGDERCVRAVTVHLGGPGDARRVSAISRCARHLDIEHVVVHAGATRKALIGASPTIGPWSGINTDTRVIQAFLFREADAERASVASTADYSERLLGRHTEAFYGQVEPLGTMYKTEVRTLAETLGVLDFLSDPRAGCDDHWYDDEVLGVGYDVIDPLLHLLVTERRTPEQVASDFRVDDLAWLERLSRRISVQPLRLTTMRPASPDARPTCSIE